MPRPTRLRLEQAGTACLRLVELGARPLSSSQPRGSAARGASRFCLHATPMIILSVTLENPLTLRRQP